MLLLWAGSYWSRTSGAAVTVTGQTTIFVSRKPVRYRIKRQV